MKNILHPSNKFFIYIIGTLFGVIHLLIYFIFPRHVEWPLIGIIDVPLRALLLLFRYDIFSGTYDITDKKMLFIGTPCYILVGVITALIIRTIWKHLLKYKDRPSFVTELGCETIILALCIMFINYIAVAFYQIFIILMLVWIIPIVVAIKFMELKAWSRNVLRLFTLFALLITVAIITIVPWCAILLAPLIVLIIRIIFLHETKDVKSAMK